MKKTLLAYPYVLWAIIFIIFPLLLVLFYSVIIATDSGFTFTLVHFKRVFEPLYLTLFWRSIKLAVICTLVCLAIGYPMAYLLSGLNVKLRNILILLFVVPMWMNFLARTYAWMTLLEKNGLINEILMFLHLPTINILYTDYAVVLGMVYNFLPFMVLPIYSVLIKADKSLIEAAGDLGATPVTVFRRITFPLSLPGVMSGITMVFMPAVTTFVISRLLGGAHYYLIGNLIEQQFTTSYDWGFGSALSTVLMIMILLSIGFMSRYEKENEGGRLW
ncbi:spermidine/putrescine transport system permease protein [Desulfonispora thiosulfatigenes DSM 11270]|uniref:Spermidine/putrescine transport system permease protein n=1 Tax=Desulfonispora thiosulfatigenes DSM 11270 TaxID=656914 RepID=A0A1W1VAQ4_DESTI|nr:ABC transporter permease [Desulfonispora thiosulfatigenes]SMB90499.1 spermidine/putrescine transport system permease protein [Desulfonispora thiosulfatigenes DSM 11270]